jgi:putative ubiquitin-RnfH superfamily antitoxin RatB of RatAB toxin-antitoxin module
MASVEGANAPSTLRVEIAFSPRAGEVVQTAVSVAPGTTVSQALRASGLPIRHPELQAATLVLGIWGVTCGPDAVLRGRDRVEVYRALTVDPKEARRLRYRSSGGNDNKAGVKGKGNQRAE